MRRLLALIALLAFAVAAAPADAKRPRHAKRLKAFTSCHQLVDYATRHVLVPPLPFAPDAPVGTPVPTTGGEGSGEAPAAPVPAAGGAEGDDTSGTNTQEAGVGEPDSVKTDGATVFVLANGKLHAVDARAGAPTLLGVLDLGDSRPERMFLRGGKVLALGTHGDGTRMLEIDVRDPAHMAILRTQEVDGWLVDARRVGRGARIVVASPPDALYEPPEERGQPSDWLPQSTFKSRVTGRKTVRQAVRCRAVRRPASFGGSGLLTVYTVDMDAGLPAADADAIVTSGDLVYASPTSLYVATQRWDGDTFEPGTMLHRFDISAPAATRYSASGFVRGTLLNQFAMSEQAGVLRAASTAFGIEGSESLVTTLSERDGFLYRRGEVDGLGKGERIYAVRFLGNAGYVVTFRQTDPLYTLDLSDPDHPRLAGELAIPGYSAYLHPVGEGLLLGVGQDADPATGRVSGLQLSLFDVSDLAHPQRLQKLSIGERFSHSVAEFDHHAFLWWAATGLAVLPIDAGEFTGAAGFSVDREQGIAEVGRITHPAPEGGWAPSIQRSVVAGGRLFTVSDHGVRASALAGLADDGFAAFPDPPANVPVPVDVPPGIPVPMAVP
jgi:uncharacterized secreted protein with C-terminal beta-propeller domain